jgi:hypothetical protein
VGLEVDAPELDFDVVAVLAAVDAAVDAAVVLAL